LYACPEQRVQRGPRPDARDASRWPPSYALNSATPACGRTLPGFFHREIVLPHVVEDARSSGELGGGLTLEDDVVVLRSSAGVGRVPEMTQVMPEIWPIWPRCLSSTFRSPRTITSSSRRPSSRTTRYTSSKTFNSARFIRIGVDIDQRERERLVGDGPRTRNQPTSGSRCNRSSGSATVYSCERSTSMVPGRKRTRTALCCWSCQPGPDHVIVLPSVGVDQFDKVRQQVVIGRANLLDRDQVEIADDPGQDVHHLGLARLGFAKDLDIESGHADRAVERAGGGAKGSLAAVSEWPSHLRARSGCRRSLAGRISGRRPRRR